MSLTDWQKNGWLTSHRTSAHEVADLLAVVERDLADSAAEAVSADWRMNIAYNAALQAATVALAVSGYRAARDQHHFRIIQSLRETIGMSAASIATFSMHRHDRNGQGSPHRPDGDPARESQRGDPDRPDGVAAAGACRRDRRPWRQRKNARAIWC